MRRIIYLNREYAVNNENLKPFKKGQSGNPKGRKKGSLNYKTIIEKVLNQEMEIIDPQVNKKIKKTLYEIGLTNQINRWINGDNTAGKDILDRYHGKAKENINIDGNITLPNLDKLLGAWIGNTNTKTKKSDKKINKSKV
jgi:hypothetical protein